jgi:serine phosphatase RsbU (regulator of sigma subunit)/HAMP domain-containing protein
MKLNTKLMIMAGLIGIPLVVIAVVFILKTQETLEYKIRERHMDLAAHLAERTDAFDTENERFITTFLYNFKKDEAAPAADTENSPKQIDPGEQLLFLRQQVKHFRIMTVMNRSGAVLSQVTAPQDIGPAEVAAHVGAVPAETVIGQGKPFHSAPHPAGGGALLARTVAFPFGDGERLLAVEISLQPIQEMIASVSFSRNGSAFLVDSRGLLAAHPDIKRALAREDMSGIPFIKKALDAPAQGLARVANFKDASGESMLGAFKPVQGGGLVLVQEPKRDAYHTATVMKNMAKIAVLLSALFALLAGVFIARSILGPMNVLVQGTEHLSQGDLDYAVPISSNNEMGKLAGAFNHMSHSLAEREKAISRINKNAKELTAILNRNSLALAALATMQEIARARLIGILIADRNTGRLQLSARQDNKEAPDPQLPQHLDTAAHRSMSQQISISEQGPGDSPYMAVPLMFENEVKGALVVDERLDGAPFTQTDMDLFGIIASSIAISVQNIELIEDTVEKTRMEQELQTAELVQKTLFPKNPPIVPGLELKGFIESASETGGDWYGFVHEPENSRVAIIIADVTGHGVPAALVTATTSSFFKTLEIFRSYSHKGAKAYSPDSAMPGYRTGFDPLSPDFMLRCLNEIIRSSTDGKLVMTLFASVYYYDEQRLVYANAGHNVPMIYRQSGLPTKKKKTKQLGFLISKGMRLGDEPDVSFKEHEFILEPGDAILWYTDGLIECENPHGEEYGESRLKDLFGETAAADTSTIYDHILERSYSFFGDQPHKDDITFVVGKCLAQGQAADVAHPEVSMSRDLGIHRALLVSDDKRFSKQLSWFLTGHGAEVAQFASAADALKNSGAQPLDLCIAPLGGGLEQISLITLLKEKNPEAKFIFICSVPFDTMIPVLLELDLPMHLIHAQNANLLTSVQTAAAKFSASTFWGIREYLSRGTQVYSIKIRNTGSRMREAAPLLDFGAKVGLTDHMLNTLANLTDELLMNAMYDAPTDKKGRHKYAAADRSEDIKLNELEAPVLEYGSDGHHLAVGVSDPFGGLTRATILAYLEKCLFNDEKQIDDKAGGAGLGLFEIYNAVDSLIFNVQPGTRTQVICLMKLKLDVKFSKRNIETLCFFERTADRDQH